MFSSRQFPPNTCTALCDAGLVGTVSSAIFLVWALAAKLATGHATGRALEFHGNLDAEQWIGGLNTLSAHLLPTQIPLALRIALLLVVVAGGTYLCLDLMRRGRRVQLRKNAEMLVIILGLFFFFYIGFVALSAHVEANLFLSARYAFPVYVTTVILMAVVLGNAAPTGRRPRYLAQAFAGLAILVLATHVVRTADRTRDAYVEGLGFASLSWSTSPIIQAISKLPTDASIFSNATDAIAYVLKRKSHYVPQRFDFHTGLEDPANPFEKQVEDLRRQLASGNTYVVFLDRVDWRFYLVSEEDLQKLLKLELVDKQADGRIYALPASLQDE